MSKLCFIRPPLENKIKYSLPLSLSLSEILGAGAQQTEQGPDTWPASTFYLLPSCGSEVSLCLSWDFPGGPVVKNSPSSAGDAGSIPGRGTKIPHVAGKLTPRATTRETRTPQWRPSAAKKNKTKQKSLPLPSFLFFTKLCCQNLYFYSGFHCAAWIDCHL